MIEIDRRFSRLSSEKGIAAAFDEFAADSAIIYRDGRDPIKGRDSIHAFYSRRRDEILQRKPFFAEIAAGGDLGYTLGNYQYLYVDSAGKSDSSFGRYVSIWRKQSDGSWKFVFDAGDEARPIERKEAANEPERNWSRRFSDRDK
jgi:ketosteroid isomerase-like protein